MWIVYFMKKRKAANNRNEENGLTGPTIHIPQSSNQYNLAPTHETISQDSSLVEDQLKITSNPITFHRNESLLDRSNKSQHQELQNQDNAPPIEINITNDDDTAFVSYDSSSYFCDTLSTYYVPKSKFFLSYIEKEATEAAMLMKTELETMGHQCSLDLFQTDNSPSAMEDSIQKCDVFLPILTENYFRQRDRLIELTWAMKHKKKVQPLHLPIDKDNIGLWISTAPEAFRWIFAINFHPIFDADSQILAGMLPTIVSDAIKLYPCPPLPDGRTAEALVDQAMLEIDKQESK